MVIAGDRRAWCGRWLGALLAGCVASAPVVAQELPAFEDGRAGGRLVMALRAEPRTFNPLVAADGPSREIIWRTAADLIHINRETQRTEPALATSWRVSSDGLRYTLELRRGVRFSNGDPFDADDVVFSIAAYLDTRVGSPQRELLVIDGKAITVRKLASHTVQVELARPYAAAERLFDGIAMLPHRRLAAAYEEGRLGAAWGLGTSPAEVVGLGPFRLKAYRPGDRVVLERNPYYWKTDARGIALPYLDELFWLVVPSEEAQALRFQAGELDVLNRVPAGLVPALARGADHGAYAVHDLGASLEYNFAFFNLATDAGRHPLFQDVRFRQAVSLTADRAGIARLVYGGRATPIWGHVTPGNRLWLNATLPKPARAPGRARELLRAAGCRWSSDGGLLDSRGAPVTFTLLVAAGNGPMNETATMLQADLKEIGIQVQIVPVEFRAMLDRILKSRDYDAAVLRLGTGDVDPNGEMNVWPSSGATHIWNPGRPAPATVWEADMDRLMRDQLTVGDGARRKALYDRVQAIVAEQLPIIPLVSPNVVVAAKRSLGNLRPAVLDHYTLWNADVLFWRSVSERTR